MHIDKLYECTKKIQESGVIFYYSGYLSQKMLKSIGDVIKEKLSYEDINSSTIKRIFSVFVEQTQNIIKYSSERIYIDNSELSQGVIILGSENSNFFLECGNLVSKDVSKNLKTELIKIQGMDKDELKSYYKEKLKSDSSYTKGAGIGLIDIARKSTKPIEFDIKEQSQNSFFFLKAFI